MKPIEKIITLDNRSFYRCNSLCLIISIIEIIQQISIDGLNFQTLSRKFRRKRGQLQVIVFGILLVCIVPQWSIFKCALRDLVSFVQLKKCEKHPRSVTFRKVAG